MYYETPSIRVQSPTHLSFFHIVKQLRWTDVAVVSSCVALLIIGALSSGGVFNFIGVANGAYLSYGMYGGAVILFVTEVVKLVVLYKRLSLSKSHSNTLTGPLTTDEIFLLKFTAEDFVQKSNYPNKTQLTTRINTVLDNPSFAQDPPKYMSSWGNGPKQPLEAEAYSFFHSLVFN